MVYLATDKQTYADLSITETASNEQFLFSLFSKTETKEGKALMLNWIMYPLSDLEEIRKRQEAIVWDALPELLLNEEELDFIEYYLAYRDQIREAHILLSC
ncbi:MAG TPA: DNA mismatch repair protein MutS, partial [Candidatus Bacteroides intestinigallinarum]|nr:DNA mismatch repair protein MutS [Candidatus Bacteroides intestinigallinarum]